MDVRPVGFVLYPDRPGMPVPGGDQVIPLIEHLVDVLGRAGHPAATAIGRLPNDETMIQLQAECLTVPTTEDGKTVLQEGGLLLAGNTGAPRDQPLARYTADDDLKRCQECTDGLMPGSSGQGR